jgi:hypothetical protein
VNLKKLWQDPVGSNAIAGIIVVVVVAIAGWVVHRENWWPALWHGIVTAGTYLLGTTPVRRWVLGTLILMAGSFVVLLIGIIVTVAAAKDENRKQSEPTGSDWYSYTTDSFFGLKWSWNYEGREIQLRAALCPHCDYQVYPDDSSSYANGIRFRCDICKRTIPVQDQSWQSLQDIVTRLIHQKLRTRTYPKATAM